MTLAQGRQDNQRLYQIVGAIRAKQRGCAHTEMWRPAKGHHPSGMGHHPSGSLHVSQGHHLHALKLQPGQKENWNRSPM